ncbi:hypothetical protein EI534_18630 [Pseudomonas frederiksbergensis]|nr:hypothetical protein [Pseudomonas frederiksbergensis]
MIRCGSRFERESTKPRRVQSRASPLPQGLRCPCGSGLAREEARPDNLNLRAARRDPGSPADTARHPAQGWKSPASLIA